VFGLNGKTKYDRFEQWILSVLCRLRMRTCSNRLFLSKRNIFPLYQWSIKNRKNGCSVVSQHFPCLVFPDRGRIMCYLEDRLISLGLSKVIKPTGYKLKLCTNNKYTNNFGISLTNFIGSWYRTDWASTKGFANSTCNQFCSDFLGPIL